MIKSPGSLNTKTFGGFLHDGTYYQCLRIGVSTTLNV